MMQRYGRAKPEMMQDPPQQQHSKLEPPPANELLVKARHIESKIVEH